MPLHPIILFTFPVVSFYLTNVKEAYVYDIFLPLGVSLMVGLILFLLFIVFYHKLHIAGFLTSVSGVLFFSYGHIVDLVTQLPLFFDHQQLLTITQLVFAFIFLFTIIVTWQNRTTMISVTKFLNIIGCALGLMLITQLLIAQLNHQVMLTMESTNNAKADMLNSSSRPATLPDIYYLIFDRYAGNKTLKDYYSYNNSSFLDQLSQRGFYVASDSHTNYPLTAYSIASSLNMDYLQNIPPSNDSQTDWRRVIPLLQHPRIINDLKQLGYAYYHIGSWYEYTKSSPDATINYFTTSAKPPLNDFTVRFFSTTLIRSLSNAYFQLDAETLHRTSISNGFLHAQEVIHSSGPKFVFAHILMPHQPYVFTKECNEKHPPIESEVTVIDYTDQLQCANIKILNLIDQILGNTSNPPIIIVQADEGPETIANPMKGTYYEFKNATSEAINERTRILNAYYFPNKDYSTLYQDITPINTFRLVLNQYFNQELPLLPDKTYLFEDSEKMHQFEFIEVNQ